MEFYGYCPVGKTADCYKTWETAGTKFFRGSYSEQAGAFKDRNVDGTFTFLPCLAPPSPRPRWGVI